MLPPSTAAAGAGDKGAQVDVSLRPTYIAAAQAAASGPAPAAAAKPAAKAAPKKAASEHTKEEMVAALTELRDAKGKDVAKAVISEHGGVEKMADIPDDKIDAVYAAAKAAMEDGDDGM